MICFDIFSPNKVNNPVPLGRMLCGILLLLIAAGLTACSSKEKKAGQALVRVNGEEITVLQINDELRRAGVKADQQEAATRQLLESLINRQLITDEAMRNKIHRTPEVIQAIERAKAKIIEQAYLGSVAAKIARPSKAEINDYFQMHPEYYAERKQFDMQQLIIATRDMHSELRLAINAAKSLNEVAAWLDRHNVAYARGQLSRSSTDLPEQMVAKLKEMRKGQLFIVNQGESSLLNAISDVRDSPVSVVNAAPQIEQHLIGKKTREVADAKIALLRSTAKIQYLNASSTATH